MKTAESAEDSSNLPLVVIHTVGKVGFTTLGKAIERTGSYTVKQTHFLNSSNLANYKERCEQRQFKRTPPHVKESEYVLEALTKQTQKRIRFITLLRDPISGNISGFFQNLEHFGFTPNAPTPDMDKLIAVFKEKYGHYNVFQWLDKEMNPVIGVNVFKHAFPKNAGFTVIQGTRADLLVLKLSLQDSVIKKIVEAFLGLENLDIAPANTAEKKWYSPLYQEFKQQVTFTDEYLNAVAHSKYFKHFHTTEERDELFRQWCPQGGFDSKYTFSRSELEILKNPK